MKKKLTVYPAIFTKYNDDNEYYVIEFIDFEGCITEGKNLQEAFYMAQDVLGLCLDDFSKLPEPTIDFSNIQLEKNQFISYVNIDLNEYRRKYNNKSIKKTLSIPCWLNTLAEKNNINFSQVLQEALKNKLEILDIDNL